MFWDAKYSYDGAYFRSELDDFIRKVTQPVSETVSTDVRSDLHEYGQRLIGHAEEWKRRHYMVNLELRCEVSNLVFFFWMDIRLCYYKKLHELELDTPLLVFWQKRMQVVKAQFDKTIFEFKAETSPEERREVESVLAAMEESKRQFSNVMEEGRVHFVHRYDSISETIRTLLSTYSFGARCHEFLTASEELVEEWHQAFVCILILLNSLHYGRLYLVFVYAIRICYSSMLLLSLILRSEVGPHVVCFWGDRRKRNDALAEIQWFAALYFADYW